ncbi:hypothetical protein ACE1TI_18810 [Alteribacillus sp. JSM 102045]|uniref:hypothetical protein n=1 Tax=Alteribacillus sp. JSM 102045 TaxID=1562101 RepID=UPI0035C2161D
MIYNILIGMVIPWICLIFLFKKTAKVMLITFPLGISIAFLANDWGEDIFWGITPYIEKNPSLATLPINIGYFPLLACLLAYVQTKKVSNDNILIVLFSFSATFIAVSGGFTVRRESRSIS